LRNIHRRILGRKPRRTFASALAIALSIMLTADTAVFAAGGFGGLGGAFAGPKPTATPAAPDDHAQREQMASRLDALAEVAQRVANEAPRDHDDPGAVLAKTGKDPAAIVAWVRTNTREIAYVGMLRGSSGVLMDRAGNSLDRSMLLADLLRRAGNDVRLARAQLDPKLAAALRAQMEASIPKPSAPAPLDRAALLKQIGNDPRLDPAMVQKATDRTIARNQQFEATVKDLYGKVYPAVMQALGNDPKRDEKIAADTDAALRDHFWVQRHIAGGWEDLDPDADVVHKLTPEATLTPEQVPDSLKHRVTMRVIVETWSAGKLSESKLLERTWTPSELMGKSITLSHQVFPQSPIDQIAQQPNPQDKYLEALTNAWVIEPVLRVGSDNIADKLYTLRGEVMPASEATLSSLGVQGTGGSVSQSAQGVLGAFGSKAATPSGPPDEATAPVRVSAEWVEFQSDVPGRRPQIHRREVYDLIGPALRLQGVKTPPPIGPAIRQQRALKLAGTADLYIFGETPNIGWVQATAGSHIAEIAKSTAALIRSQPSLAKILRTPPTGRLGLPLWSWALGRDSQPAALEASPVAPNIAVLWQTPGAAGSRDSTEFDIVANELNAGGDRRVSQGVLDTVLEHVLFATPTETGGNTAALFAADLKAGIQWVRLGPENLQAASNLSLPPDAVARIKSDLANGNVVLAPKRATHTANGDEVAWWRIDPRTGDTLGIGESGRGVEFTEEGGLLMAIGLNACALKTLAVIMIGKEASAGTAISFAVCVAISFAHLPLVWGGLGVLEIVLTFFEFSGLSEPKPAK
jgi:hypothetical protein